MERPGLACQGKKGNFPYSGVLLVSSLNPAEPVSHHQRIFRYLPCSLVGAMLRVSLVLTREMALNKVWTACRSCRPNGQIPVRICVGNDGEQRRGLNV